MNKKNYVCQSVGWLTSLLKLDRYRDISSSGWDIFLIFLGDNLGMLVHLLQMILNVMYVCQSVCLLTSWPKLNKGISPVLDEIYFWFLLIYYWDVSTLAPNDSEFPVCLSVCLFPYCLTKIRQRDISSSGWDIFLEFFGDIPELLVHWFQIILNFLYVC